MVALEHVNYTLADLVNFSSAQRPVDFENAFSQILGSRINDTVARHKITVAKQLFNSPGKEPAELAQEG